MILRPVTERDSEKITTWRNDPTIKPFFFEKSEFTIEGHLAWFRKYKERLDHEIYFMIIHEGAEIGTVSIQDIREARGEVCRLLISPELQGKGYGKLALDRLTEYARQRGLTKLYAHIYSHNQASRRSFEKSGFRFVRESSDRCYYEKNIV